MLPGLVREAVKAEQAAVGALPPRQWRGDEGDE
jgi:hypothetical protein